LNTRRKQPLGKDTERGTLGSPSNRRTKVLGSRRGKRSLPSDAQGIGVMDAARGRKRQRSTIFRRGGLKAKKKLEKEGNSWPAFPRRDHWRIIKPIQEGGKTERSGVNDQPGFGGSVSYKSTKGRNSPQRERKI